MEETETKEAEWTPVWTPFTYLPTILATIEPREYPGIIYLPRSGTS